MMKSRMIALLILICLLGTYQYYAQMQKQCELQKTINELQESYHSESNNKDFTLSVLKEDMKICLQNEGLVLDPNIPINENGGVEHALLCFYSA